MLKALKVLLVVAGSSTGDIAPKRDLSFGIHVAFETAFEDLKIRVEVRADQLVDGADEFDELGWKGFVANRVGLQLVEIDEFGVGHGS